MRRIVGVSIFCVTVLICSCNSTNEKEYEVPRNTSPSNIVLMNEYTANDS